MPKVMLEVDRHPKYPRLSIDRRANSRFYQARTYLDQKIRLKSTKTDHLPTAFKIAEDWYKRELRASVAFGRQHPTQRLTTDPTVGELFASYRVTLAGGERQRNADQKWGPIADFWRAKTLSSIGPKTFTEFFAWRRKQFKGIKNHSIHKGVVLIRQILKHAIESELLDRLPVVPRVGKILANPRPWLTKAEWRRLLKVSGARIQDAENARTAQQRQDLHDQMLFMIASMVRVGELLALKFNDCTIRRNAAKQPILLAEVTGKQGTRTIVAMRDAVDVFQRRLRATGDDRNALVFPEHHRDAFRELLKAAGLYKDAQGFSRNMKSLRATSISFAILDSPSPNLLVIARNAGTSVAMIDQFYAKRLTAEMHADTLTTRRRKLVDAFQGVPPAGVEFPEAR